MEEMYTTTSRLRGELEFQMPKSLWVYAEILSLTMPGIRIQSGAEQNRAEQSRAAMGWRADWQADSSVEYYCTEKNGRIQES
jgi:hypothetical protein